jgi:hypothetical protein
MPMPRKRWAFAAGPEICGLQTLRRTCVRVRLGRMINRSTENLDAAGVAGRRGGRRRDGDGMGTDFSLELRHPTGGIAIGLWACRPFVQQRTGSWSDPVRTRAVNKRGGMKAEVRSPVMVVRWATRHFVCAGEKKMVGRFDSPRHRKRKRFIRLPPTGLDSEILASLVSRSRFLLPCVTLPGD